MRIPNVQDLRMRPEYIRYVIIFQTAAGPRLATTYRHAERVYNDNNVEKVCVGRPAKGKGSDP